MARARSGTTIALIWTGKLLPGTKDVAGRQRALCKVDPESQTLYVAEKEGPVGH